MTDVWLYDVQECFTLLELTMLTISLPSSSYISLNIHLDNMAEETSATSAPAAAASAEPTKEVSLGNGEVTMDDATAGSDKPDDTAQGEGTSGTVSHRPKY